MREREKINKFNVRSKHSMVCCIKKHSIWECLKKDSIDWWKIFPEKNSDCKKSEKKKPVEAGCQKSCSPFLTLFVSNRCSWMRWSRWAYWCHLFEKFTLYVSLWSNIFKYLYPFLPIWIIYIGSNNFYIDSIVGYPFGWGVVVGWVEKVWGRSLNLPFKDKLKMKCNSSTFLNLKFWPQIIKTKSYWTNY